MRYCKFLKGCLSQFVFRALVNGKMLTIRKARGMPFSSIGPIPSYFFGFRSTTWESVISSLEGIAQYVSVVFNPPFIELCSEIYIAPFGICPSVKVRKNCLNIYIRSTHANMQQQQKNPNKNKTEKKVFIRGNSPELYKFTSTKAFSKKNSSEPNHLFENLTKHLICHYVEKGNSSQFFINGPHHKSFLFFLAPRAH